MCISTETDPGCADQSGEMDLDWESQEILRALYKNNGSANTTEIRTLTGIDSNDKVLYRFREKLAPQRLIELEQPESATARPEPKIATFTQAGVELAEQIIDERAAPTDLGSRVDKLKADHSRITEQIENVPASQAGDGHDTASSSTVDLAELDKKTDQLLYLMGLIADFLNDHHDGGLGEYRTRREK